MSATGRDFMPWQTAYNAGQISDVNWWPRGASTINIAEPVYVTSSGTVKPSPDSATLSQFGGIAAGPAVFTRNGTTVRRNPRTGNDFATNDMFPVWVMRPGTRFISANFGSAGTNVAPTLANIGDVCGIDLGGVTAGLYSVDTSQTGATVGLFRVFDVLDLNRKSVGDPTSNGYVAGTGGTGVYVVVEVVQCEWNQNAAPSA